MMRRFNPPPAESVVAGGSAQAAEWEVRPSGMLVQKRETAAVPAAPTIRVKVKYGEGYHEIYVSAEATFGDVKKRVAERVGMHHLDLKVMFKDRERDPAAFIDVAGVKEGSKMLAVEDPTAKARRILEERRQHKMDKAARQVSAISMEVDRLIAKVTALEAIVSKGSKVVEKDILQLIELLMAQLIQLDGVVADGDAKVQRGLQVRRVQRYVEALDAIKIKNETQTQPDPPQQPQMTLPKPPTRSKPQQQPLPSAVDTPRQPQSTLPKPPTRPKPHQLPLPSAADPPQQPQTTLPKPPTRPKPQQQPLPSAAKETTKWETFDSLFTPSTSTVTSKVTSKAATPVPRFKWELF